MGLMQCSTKSHVMVHCLSPFEVFYEERLKHVPQVQVAEAVKEVANLTLQEAFLIYSVCTRMKYIL